MSVAPKFQIAALLIVLGSFVWSPLAHSIQPMGRRSSGHLLYKLRNNPSPESMRKLDMLLSRSQAAELVKVRSGRLRTIRAGSSVVGIVSTSDEALAREIMKTGAVEFAHPDYEVPEAATPNDPDFSQQYFHTKIGSERAWDFSIGSAVIKVVVCDSGIQADHPDLAGNLLLPGRNTASDNTDTSPVSSHGTLVAGTMGAIGNNGVGLTGMNWNIKILPGRATNKGGSATLGNLAKCIRWGADQGAKVVNASYDAGQWPIMDSAGQYLRDRGGLLFIAAGNSGADISDSYPDYSSFVLVGSTTSDDSRSSFSNFGTAIDMVAPGSAIRTTDVASGYRNAYGTSFASPIAAGAAALIWSLNPNFTPDQVETILFSTTVDLGGSGNDSVFGHGRLDAGAAMELASTYPGTSNSLPTASFFATPTSGLAPLPVSFDASASSDSDGTITSYSWSFGDGQTSSGVSPAHTYTSGGNHTAILTVIDNDGGTDTTNIFITVEEPNIPNILPTASFWDAPM